MGRKGKVRDEEKLKAVEHYKRGEGSLLSICKMHGIRSDGQLHKWISTV